MLAAIEEHHEEAVEEQAPTMPAEQAEEITEAYSKPSWLRNKKHTDEQLLRRLQLWG